MTKIEKRVVVMITSMLMVLSMLSGVTVSAQEWSGNEITEAISIDGSYTGNVDAGNSLWYSFTPNETGTYRFYTVGTMDTCGCLYSADQQVIGSDNDGGENLNYSISAALQAEVTYYLESRFFSDLDAGEITVSVERVAEAEPQLNVASVENSNEAVMASVASVSVAAASADVISGDYTYADLADGTVKITGYQGTATDISIPGTLDGKTVSIIGEEAFHRSEVTSVTIPKSVTEIQYLAFRYSSVSTVSFEAESQLKTLGNQCFEGASITSINLPSGLETIGSAAFAGCGSLVTVSLPNTVTTIGSSTFAGCGKIKKITIPDSVTSLGASCFEYCGALEKVTLGKGISTIKEYTFFCCYSLKNISMPESITGIEYAAFDGAGLTEIKIPNDCTYIDACAFMDCPLESVDLGTGIKTIREYAFYNTKITSLVVPDSVTKIAYESFGSDTLQSIQMPEDLSDLNVISGAFQNTAWWKNQAEGLVSIGSMVYGYKGTAPQTVVIPEGTTAISALAFYYDTDASTVRYEIPVSVVNIGDYAIGYQVSDGEGILLKDAMDVKEQQGWTGSFTWFNETKIAKRSDVVIVGGVGTAAEVYAKQHGFTFEAKTYPQDAPAAPVVASKTTTSVTLQEMSGCEYSMDGTNWQTSSTFSGLTPDTEYTFYARKAAGGCYDASAGSTGTTVRTDKEVPVSNGEWLQDGTGWWYRHADGSYTANGWEFIDGFWYLFNGSGYMLTGWQQVGGNWYYLYASGAMASDTYIGDYYVNSDGVWVTVQASAGWKQDGTDWWYCHADGSYTTNGWELIGGLWYFFNGSGYMETGWMLNGGTWYYLGADGAMATGWQSINGSWYYFYSSGAMAADTYIGDYYVNSNGEWVTAQSSAGWELDSIGWWYRHADGSYTVNGWELIGGLWYFFNSSGYMQTGWIFDAGNWYYLYDSGAMASDTYIGDYYVNKDGVWVN